MNLIELSGHMGTVHILDPSIEEIDQAIIVLKVYRNAMELSVDLKSITLISDRWGSVYSVDSEWKSFMGTMGICLYSDSPMYIEGRKYHSADLLDIKEWIPADH